MDLVVKEFEQCGDTCAAQARSVSFAFLLIAAILYLLPLNTFVGDKFEELRNGRRTVERRGREASEGESNDEQLQDSYNYV